MNAREFFYLAANMRKAQKTYFKTRDQRDLRLCKVLESQVDEEIYRVSAILSQRELSDIIET